MRSFGICEGATLIGRSSGTVTTRWLPGRLRHLFCGTLQDRFRL
jgi:hypothetical protein